MWNLTGHWEFTTPHRYSAVVVCVRPQYIPRLLKVRKAFAEMYNVCMLPVAILMRRWRCTLAFHVRLDLLFACDRVLPKLVLRPLNAHLAITFCTFVDIIVYVQPIAGWGSGRHD